jgi:hypothetical protein
MTDKEVTDLEERRSRHDYNQTVQKVKRLATVVDVLPKPRRRPFGYRCPRCGRKLRMSVTEVQSTVFACYWFKYTYWRCGPEGWYLGGCGYEYGTVETQVKDVKLNDVLLNLIDEARGSD